MPRSLEAPEGVGGSQASGAQSSGGARDQATDDREADREHEQPGVERRVEDDVVLPVVMLPCPNGPTPPPDGAGTEASSVGPIASMIAAPP